MERIYWVHLIVMFCFGMLMGSFCQDDPDEEITAVYIATLKQAPAVAAPHFDASAASYIGELRRGHKGSRKAVPPKSTKLHKHRPRNITRSDPRYGSYIARAHDSLLRRALRGEKYLKLYSYHYLINGFSVLVTPQQVFGTKRDEFGRKWSKTRL